MKTSEFDFTVPRELIAHEPTQKRDQSRLMVLGRRTGDREERIEHRRFHDIIDYLTPGDLLVLNNTKVIPANLMGRKEGGGKIEVLLVKRMTLGNKKCEMGKDVRNQKWECLVKPGKKLKVGSKVVFGEEEVEGEVLEKMGTGEQIIKFTGDLDNYINSKGRIPLPPYINSSLGIRHSSLTDRYQTVYAEKEGASAAPTAGLHFTPELLEKIKAKGVEIAYVTLHTGLATFKPVYAENIEDHKMYYESYEVPAETIEAIKVAKKVIAVGTTSVRTLEALSTNIKTNKRISNIKGETNLFIYPGYEFKVVDAMITNFHWPRTTLIMLVSAFAGKDFISRAYQEAIKEKYRFFSFGDAMLIY